MNQRFLKYWIIFAISIKEKGFLLLFNAVSGADRFSRQSAQIMVIIIPAFLAFFNWVVFSIAQKLSIDYSPHKFLRSKVQWLLTHFNIPVKHLSLGEALLHSSQNIAGQASGMFVWAKKLIQPLTCRPCKTILRRYPLFFRLFTGVVEIDDQKAN